MGGCINVLKHATEKLSKQDETEIIRIFERHVNGGSWHLEKEIKTLVAARDLNWLFPVADKAKFIARVRFLQGHSSMSAFQAIRRKQLSEQSDQNLVPQLWCYGSANEDNQNCCEHQILDGVTLPPDHPFWSEYLAPNSYGCGCYVTAAISWSSMERRRPKTALRSDLPSPVISKLQGAGQPFGIERGFERNEIPSMEEALGAVASMRAEFTPATTA